MEKRIITVSRQFGSGGRSIAKAVAQELGIAYYDKELVKQVATETGFDPGYIEEHGELAPSKSRFAYAFFPQGVPGVMDGLSPAEFLWNMQREIILRLADKEPCVIVGRCADYILRDREDCLNVFIHAADQYRAGRIVRLYGETEKDPLRRLDEKDKKRAVNYRHFTGREWGMATNYHLSLDTGVITEESCVSMIVGLYKGNGLR